MRIQNQPELTPVDRTSVQKVAVAPAVSNQETTVGKASAEKVTVSAEALSLAEQQGAKESKMARLAAALKDGSFQVDAKAIAQKLVGDGE